ncbi:MAG: hypothetical protein PF541_07905 [Prolixibacteraceae bacterium]|nr:hypothetical protein [Prolixibacteraceae bacterium]
MLNDKKFRSIYNEFLESGLTVRDYCSNQQMNEAKFYYWKNKLKDQLPAKKEFVPLVFEHGKQRQPPHVPALGTHGIGAFLNPATKGKTFSCEVSYPNGVCVKLNNLDDIEVLRSLLVLAQHQDV